MEDVLKEDAGSWSTGCGVHTDLVPVPPLPLTRGVSLDSSPHLSEP